jgi:hypothetical protein
MLALAATVLLASCAKPSLLYDPANRLQSPDDLRSFEDASMVARVCVTADGRPSSITVKTPSRSRLLDLAGIGWLKRQRYRPGTVAWLRVSKCYDQDITWHWDP